jgi:hypothetical protein
MKRRGVAVLETKWRKLISIGAGLSRCAELAAAASKSWWLL